MSSQDSTNLERRALLGAFAGLATISAAPAMAGVFSYNKGAGNIRSIHMRNPRTGETLNAIYWIEGRYITPVMKEINWFMRDWRENSTLKMNREMIDLVAATHVRLESKAAINLLSGYRTPRTNAMLRRRSRNVAKDSFHTKGMACDMRIPGRSVTQLARAATAARVGGVGRYHRMNFVHVDTGPIRSWRA